MQGEEKVEPAPLDRVIRYGAVRLPAKIAVMSLAHLKPPPASDAAQEQREAPFADQHRRRIFVRNLLKTSSHFLLRILGYGGPQASRIGQLGCHQRRCLLYRQHFDPYAHSFFLCSACETKFCSQHHIEKVDNFFHKIILINHLCYFPLDTKPMLKKRHEVV